MIREPVEDLIAAAGRGDDDAWAALVARYTPLVWGITNRFRLDRADAADVNQTVWLRVVEHLHRLREPAALPMWIARTAHHECLQVLRTSNRLRSFDPFVDTGHPNHPPADDAAVEAEVLRAERRQALRDGFAQLPARCQRLISLLLQDPPVSYGQISGELGVPVGSIGPTRSRCLDKLRASPALTAFIGAPVAEPRGDRRGAAVLGQ